MIISRQNMGLPIDLSDGIVLLVDKPLRWTSFDIVHRVRSLLGVRKAGHGGTLDPMATGLLILCTGKKTKEIEQISSGEKEYEGTLKLGATTASFDSETPVTQEKDYSSVTEEMVAGTFATFIGKRNQIPPMYSAVKLKGKPLYRYARKGKVVERDPRQVEITAFELIRCEFPLVYFRMRCSRGTYVRGIVDECGTILGCGAHLASLRRTQIGDFSVVDALSIEDLYALRVGTPEMATV